MRLNSISETYENYEIYLTNRKQGNAFWSEASRRTTKKFRLNIDAGSVCNFYFIVKKNCDHCRNVRDTDRTLCRVRYSSTSCIALINCQRDVNKKSMIENCELLVINIKYNLLVPLQCRSPYKHARVCYNKNRSWRDEILQYIDKNYAKCVRKVVELN